jgi:putative SOS response-associated peptidase YedK
VPADGFYEWKALSDSGRQAYHFRRTDGALFFFGALWWGHAGKAEQAALLTTQPNPVVAPIHDRMPVIIPEARLEEWLGTGEDAERARGLCASYASDSLVAVPVEDRVNSVRFDDPACLEPARPRPEQLDLFR